MHIARVNIGREHAIENGKPGGVTGIYKQPVEGWVRVTRDGIAGDVICDTKNHGGPDQAVYVYTTPDYAWWSETLGCALPPGTFGENLTITDLESASLSIGNRLHAGTIVLEVTAPRIRCRTLARRVDDDTFVARFRDAERPGVYCCVIQEGTVRAGDVFTYKSYAGETVTVLDLFRDFFEPDRSETAIRRFLAAPIAARARVHKENQLRGNVRGS